MDGAPYNAVHLMCAPSSKILTKHFLPPCRSYRGKEDVAEDSTRTLKVDVDVKEDAEGTVYSAKDP